MHIFVDTSQTRSLMTRVKYALIAWASKWAGTRRRLAGNTASSNQLKTRYKFPRTPFDARVTLFPARILPHWFRHLDALDEEMPSGVPIYVASEKDKNLQRHDKGTMSMHPLNATCAEVIEARLLSECPGFKKRHPHGIHLDWHPNVDASQEKSLQLWEAVPCVLTEPLSPRDAFYVEYILSETFDTEQRRWNETIL